MTTLNDIIGNITANPDELNVDNLREHDVRGLQDVFGLPPDETFLLYLIIQEMTDYRFSLVRFVMSRKER